MCVKQTLFYSLPSNIKARFTIHIQSYVYLSQRIVTLVLIYYRFMSICDDVNCP
jgi:hypothetical protein